jgi:hypothetical protein
MWLHAAADEGEFVTAAFLIFHPGEMLVIAYKRLALTALRRIVHNKVGTASGMQLTNFPLTPLTNWAR